MAGTLLKNQPPPAFLYHAGSQFLAASPSVTILVTGNRLADKLFDVSLMVSVCQCDSGVVLLCTGLS